MSELYSEHPVMFKNNPLGFILCLILIPAGGLGLLILLTWTLKIKRQNSVLMAMRSSLKRACSAKNGQRLISVASAPPKLNSHSLTASLVLAPSKSTPQEIPQKLSPAACLIQIKSVSLLKPIKMLSDHYVR